MARDYSAIEKEIRNTGFFSEYLPPCFNLSTKVFNRTPRANCDLIPPHCFSMSRYNGNDARRNIFIPEIGSYCTAHQYMKDHHIIEKIISFTEENDASFSPILGEDDSIMRHEQSYLRDISPVDEIPSSYIKNIATKIKRSAGAKKILKLDIANCFSSFYMHMIPSIVLGYDTAMEQYHRYLDNFQDTTIDSEYLIFNGLDEAIRRQNLNQTNGLLPGILSSKIIMEGMLTRIDHELQDKGLHFSRYMDDYEVYLFDDSEKPVISVFTQVLRKYGFSLNFEKTEIIDFPYYIAQNLERIFQSYSTDTELLSEDLMELFNSFMNLESAGTKGAIRYLLKSLEKKPITPQDPLLYQAYLLTVLENNERSLTKACSGIVKKSAV